MGLFQSASNEQRINSSAEMSLLLVAALFDVLSLVPFLNMLSGVVGWVILSGLFRAKKVNVFGSRLAFGVWFSIFIELLPVLSIAPTFFIFTKLMIAHSRKEDAARAQKNQGGGGMFGT